MGSSMSLSPQREAAALPIQTRTETTRCTCLLCRNAHFRSPRMKKHSILIIALAFFIAVTTWIGTAESQAPPAPGQQPPAPAAAAQRGAPAPGSENGIAVFQTQCFGCHGNAKAPNAPSPVAIREM